MNLRKILASALLLGLVLVPVVSRATTLESMLNALSQQIAQLTAQFSSSRQLADVTASATSNNAEILSVEGVPNPLTPGQKFVLTVKVKNTGNITWPRYGVYRLAFVDANGKYSTVWDADGRINLNQAISPGAIATFSKEIKAPAQAGTYPLNVRMYQSGENAKYFSPMFIGGTYAVGVVSPTVNASVSNVNIEALASGDVWYDGTSKKITWTSANFSGQTVGISICKVDGSGCRAWSGTRGGSRDDNSSPNNSFMYRSLASGLYNSLKTNSDRSATDSRLVQSVFPVSEPYVAKLKICPSKNGVFSSFEYCGFSQVFTVAPYELTLGFRNIFMTGFDPSKGQAWPLGTAKDVQWTSFSNSRAEGIPYIDVFVCGDNTSCVKLKDGIENKGIARNVILPANWRGYPSYIKVQNHLSPYQSATSSSFDYTINRRFRDVKVGGLDNNTWSRGTEASPVSKTITWTSDGTGSVNILFCANRDSVRSTCKSARSNVINNGTVRGVVIPKEFVGTKAVVRVEDSRSSNQTGIENYNSSSEFNISNNVPVAPVQNTSNGFSNVTIGNLADGNIWYIGTKKDIGWNRNGSMSKIKLFICPVGASGSDCWSTFPDGTNQINGAKNVPLPDYWPSGSYFVKVANYDNPSQFAVSPNFEMKAVPLSSNPVATAATELVVSHEGVNYQSGQTLILPNRDHGYQVTILNPNSNCGVSSKSRAVYASLNNSMGTSYTLPSYDDSSYPNDFFPKKNNLDQDEIYLDCWGGGADTFRKTVAIKVKPTIQAGSFVASHSYFNNYILYQWKTTSGQKANAPDPSLTCTINQNNKYYEGSRGNPLSLTRVYEPKNLPNVITDQLTNVSNNDTNSFTGLTREGSVQLHRVFGPCNAGIGTGVDLNTDHYGNLLVNQACQIDASIVCTSNSNGLATDRAYAQYNMSLEGKNNY